jgi:uncharacterized protein YcnI
VSSIVRCSLSVAAACAVVSSLGPAYAHVDVISPAFAGARQVITFPVGHGCTGADTVGIRIELPEEVTVVRALPWEFGPADVVTSSAGVPLAVEWTKPDARPTDDQFYELQMRITVPDMPFTTIYFKATQTCRSATGEESIVEWSALPGEDGEPAAGLMILPERHPGWNKFMVPIQIDELTVFDDAQIVWSGDAAYSSNPATMELIAAEPNVEVLTTIPPSSEIWVKY